jgi:hypothetical protein
MHRPGSALFQGTAIVFLAHLYDVPIPARLGPRCWRRSWSL